jgi:hypothetical protein
MCLVALVLVALIKNPGSRTDRAGRGPESARARSFSSGGGKDMIGRVMALMIDTSAGTRGASTTF